jgi:hypothetical protein
MDQKELESKLGRTQNWTVAKAVYVSGLYGRSMQNLTAIGNSSGASMLPIIQVQ